MKRIMFIATTLFVASSYTYAVGDIKEILKAKDYSEAKELLDRNLSSLNDADKAKAYNKLVDLSIDKIVREQATITENQLAEQMQTGKKQAYDTVGYNNALVNALRDANLCDKYDNMPNEKGKVKPVFHKKNQDRLFGYRLNLVNAGQDAAQKGDNEGVLKYWGEYVNSSKYSLFVDVPNKQHDQYLGQVSSLTARFAIQEKDYASADRYLDIAMGDTAEYKEALNLKLYIAQQQLRSKEDTLAYINKLENIYAGDSNNELIFGTLCNMYSAAGMKTELNTLLDNKIAKEPNNATAWALKGQTAMNANEWDKAIEAYKKSVSFDNNNPIVLTYLGYSLNAKAGDVQNATEQKALYTESMGYLEKAKELDPNREKANWNYSLYQCYYVNYGANDARTKELEASLSGK